MKIQCDVCNKDEASVFCSADEAALCAACDHRVHHANKLAGKHQRFSLIQPSPKQFPLCDICQDRRAFLFCQQDRAILCRECDIPIHRTNEHTQKHHRFLLTGDKLSATSALYSSPLSLTNPGCDSVPNLESENAIHKPISVQPTNPYPPPPSPTVATITEGGSSTSSISQYLIEMLPGWRVEDFLDSSSPASLSFSKNVDEVLPIWSGDLESNLCSFSSPENIGIWVPQAPPAPYTECPSSNIVFGSQIGFKESKEATNNKSGRKWRDDGCFAVPQISPLSNTASKRSRTF